MNPAGDPPLTGTTSRRTTKDSLSSALRLQRILTEISSDFVTRPETETGEIIESAQRMICEALSLDCSTLWLFAGDDVEMTPTSFWQRPGSPPLGRHCVTQDNLPWACRQIREGKSFRFSSVSERPPEAAEDREILIQHGAQSIVTFPLVAHGQVFGALTFATLTNEHRWTDEEVAGMEFIARMFSHVIGKRRAEERDEIQRSARAAVLGELAHEINQPLTTILANAQAARRFITQGSADPREILAILDDIIRADKRAADVIRNLREVPGDQ